ncbi:DUF4147 domain-containing protein [Candidatus Nomurabacteria bacterium]|nr:DUF4147 domain-containing protein [Candidatus Nomurabacteria bacterium]
MKIKDWIKNKNELTKTKYHKDALEITEAAYDAIDTDNAIRTSMKIHGNILNVNDHSFDLNDYENIYLVGCGKVACQAAKTIEEIFDNRIKKGVAIGIRESKCNAIDTYVGSHPIPSQVNLDASQDIIKIGDLVTENDLVVAVIGGGGSSLLCSSDEECQQSQKLYDAFLRSGGDIGELNTVRRHISDLKGGGLAKYLYPATIVSLIFSDVPGDDCSVVASGPTYKDVSTIQNAQDIIDKYNLGSFDLLETPKDDKYFEKVTNIVLVSNHNAVDAMQAKSIELGYQTNKFSCQIYDFPKEICSKLQNEINDNTVVLAGGETKLIVPDNCEGLSGRNSMLALEMLDHIKENQIFISFASDGHDNGEAAGAIIDSNTKKELEQMGLDIEKYKRCLDSFTIFKKSNNLIFTGKVEANVSDLMILLKWQ